jgi:hypothetical protein
MHRLSEKLLAILLTLLLVLSPLQGVMAGITASSDQEEGVHQMAGMHGDMVMVTDHVTDNCVQSDANDDCTGHTCSSCQCASCTLALLPIFSLPTNHTATPVLFRADDGFVSQRSSPLFRPPRS